MVVGSKQKKSCMNQQSSFLSCAIPSSGLKYIRSLDVILMGHENSHKEAHSRYRNPHQNLVEDLERAKDDWNPLGLTLSVYIPMMAHMYTPPMERIENGSSHESKIMYNCFHNFLTALSEFRNLNRLFVYALEPWWRKKKLDRDQLKYARLGAEHWRHLEKYLEQLTMGRQYDRNDPGKGPFPGYTLNQLMFSIYWPLS
jgi:hypothetical protein